MDHPRLGFSKDFSDHSAIVERRLSDQGIEKSLKSNKDCDSDTCIAFCGSMNGWECSCVMICHSFDGDDDIDDGDGDDDD